MSLALTGLGILGAQIVFGHLLVVALAMTLLRSKMKESPVWEAAQHCVAPRASIRELLKPQYLKSLAALIGMYGFWNL